MSWLHWLVGFWVVGPCLWVWQTYQIPSVTAEGVALWLHSVRLRCNFSLHLPLALSLWNPHLVSWLQLRQLSSSSMDVVVPLLSGLVPLVSSSNRGQVWDLEVSLSSGCRNSGSQNSAHEELWGTVTSKKGFVWVTTLLQEILNGAHRSLWLYCLLKGQATSVCTRKAFEVSGCKRRCIFLTTIVALGPNEF